ncbi:sigma factor-like helix-turn-helix DNA-binding protein [Sphingopyxis sp. LARHCG72]
MSEIEYIERAVARLPFLTRQVFYLCRLEDQSFENISDRLSIAIQEVECRLASALICIRRARVRYDRSPLRFFRRNRRESIQSHSST